MRLKVFEGVWVEFVMSLSVFLLFNLSFIAVLASSVQNAPQNAHAFFEPFPERT